jgi:3-deoxy-D-manno-octulosonate 8-phosphate phosphatase (KDO 8-P phosphatase)
MASELTRRARGIRLLTCDVDGVLTDGRIYVTDDGHELKAFHALDGVGLKLLMRSGVAIAWITGSKRGSCTARVPQAWRASLGAGQTDAVGTLPRLRRRLLRHIGDDLPGVPFSSAAASP